MIPCSVRVNSHLCFYSYCSTSNGRTATLEEFQHILCSMDLQGLMPLVSRIFELFDSNHDGWIDLREVMCGFSLLRTSHAGEVLRLCSRVRFCPFFQLQSTAIESWVVFNLVVAGITSTTRVCRILF